MPAPDVIVHSTSSGGTQAGLVAGCRLLGLPTRVIGVSADDSSASLQAQVERDRQRHRRICWSSIRATLERGTAIEVDDRFVGGGYGMPTDESREAIELAARTEAIFLDPDLHGESDGGPHRLRATAGSSREGQTILFWHTGGQVGLFA